MHAQLSSTQIEQFVEKNKYRAEKQNGCILSRCVDGRYVRSFDLAPLAKPGADVGDILMLCAANNEYGLGLDNQKIIEAVIEAVGGYAQVRFHTDDHAKNEGGMSFGCGHITQALADQNTYGLTDENVKAVIDFLKTVPQKGVVCEKLEGNHREEAVVVIKRGEWSMAPQSNGESEVRQVFVYHRDLDNKRRKDLVEKLLKYLPKNPSYSQEHLYDILSQISDNHLLETLSRLAKGLPLFEVSFEKDGSFTLIEKSE